MVRTGPPRGTGAPTRAAPERSSSDRAQLAHLKAAGWESRLERWRRRLGRAGYIVALTVVPMVLLSVVVVAGLHFRLQHGPVSLKAFAGLIERGISTELGEFSASVGDLEATLSEDGRLEFQLKTIEIKDQDGNTVVAAPFAGFELSRSAIWQLRVVPERVYLIEPQLSFFYSRQDGLSLAVGDPTVEGELAGEANAGRATSAGEDAALAGPLRHAPLQGHYKMPAASEDGGMQRRVDLARLLASNSARARRGEDATSYLREFGVRDATVILDYDGKKTRWRVENASVDLEHMKRRSVVSGAARIASARGPWSVSFRTEDSERRKSVSIKTSVRDLVPSALGQSMPDLSFLESLDLPVAGDASLELTTSGVLKSANFAVELGRGNVRVPGLAGTPVALDAGLLHFDYDAEARRLTMAPSTIAWGDSSITLAGEMAGTEVAGGEVDWAWEMRTQNGILAAEEFGIAGLVVEEGAANGALRPHLGEIDLVSLRVKVGGSEIALAGQVADAGGQPSIRLDGATSPMPFEIVKTLWPRALAPQARRWAGRSITKGTLGSAAIKVATGRFSAAGEVGDGASLAVEASDVEVVPEGSGIPIAVPRALIQLTAGVAEINVPDASVAAPSGGKVPLKGLRLVATGLGGPEPAGEITVRSQSSLEPVLEIVSRTTGDALAAHSEVVQSMDGKVDAHVTARFPLSEMRELRPQALSGKAKLTELKAKQKIGPLELQGGSLEFEVTEKGATGTGGLLLNGVLARLNWAHSFDPEVPIQNPLKLEATLDNSDRTQLGLDINHIVQGDVALELTVAQDAVGQPKIRVHGDLGEAELGLRDLAWKKQRGRPASVDFDVAKGSTGNIELQNFKVVGENIGIEGWLSIDSENEVREFYFPDFSLNVVSRLEVQGKLSPSKIWSIKAKGPTFDGRDFFRQLVSLSNSDEGRIKPLRPSAGIDVEADVGSIIGHSEVSLRGFKLKLSERGDKLSALEAQGTLDGGKPLSLLLKRTGDQSRILSAVTPDAGQAFKMLGFYRNLVGGRSQLEVNLDGRGAADKSGNLWIEDFRILGDPIVSEVVANSPSSGPSTGPQGERKVVREQIDFTRLFARFSAGHGQLVLEDAAVKGPVLGATIRGKIDHVTQRLNLGGTYIPLQGINAAFCNIPVVGQIISGTSCEGLLGITYQISGPVAQPQVIVNPFSIAAPGIFREIFQMTNPNPKVQPRSDGSSTEGRVGTSASPVARGDKAKNAQGAKADVIDGWSMDAGGARN